MKKKLCLLLSALLFAACLSGCSAFEKKPQDDSSSVLGGTNTPNTPSEPIAEGAFTVSIEVIGATDKEPSLEGIKAVWTAEKSVYSSPFQNGIAACNLDGDYRVTLNHAPTGFAYDSNAYSASNDRRNVIISLYPIRSFDGAQQGAQGTNKNKPLNLRDSGAYRFTYSESGETKYLSFQFNQSGVYLIKSLLNVVENETKVTLRKHSAQFINMQQEYENLGASGSYTRNFDLQLDEFIRGQDYCYSLQAERQYDDGQPFTVDIIIGRTGDFTPQSNYKPVPYPEVKPFTPPSGSFRYIAQDNANILSEKSVYLDQDGFYHKAGSKELLMFKFQNEVMDFQDPLVRLRCVIKGTGERLDYSNFIHAVFAKGQNGVYPVTPLLKEFLQNYSIANQIFYDGLGVAEAIGYVAGEADQWLFACGYFK